MTLNEKILGAMVVVLMAVIVLLALSTFSDSVKATKHDWHIAKCEKQHEKPCEITARPVE
jgi:hypothetical protein